MQISRGDDISLYHYTKKSSFEIPIVECHFTELIKMRLWLCYSKYTNDSWASNCHDYDNWDKMAHDIPKIFISAFSIQYPFLSTEIKLINFWYWLHCKFSCTVASHFLTPHSVALFKQIAAHFYFIVDFTNAFVLSLRWRHSLD